MKDYSLERDELIGLRTKGGGIVIHSTRRMITVLNKTSTKLHYINWLSENLYIKNNFRATQNNLSILLNTLFWFTTRKKYKTNSSGFFRGFVAARLLQEGQETKLYIYEAGYKDSLFPRFIWTLPNNPPDYPTTILKVLLQEINSPELTAEVDIRNPAELVLVTQ